MRVAMLALAVSAAAAQNGCCAAHAATTGGSMACLAAEEGCCAPPAPRPRLWCCGLAKSMIFHWNFNTFQYTNFRAWTAAIKNH